MNPLIFRFPKKKMDPDAQHRHVQDHLMRRSHKELIKAQFIARKDRPVQLVLK